MKVEVIEESGKRAVMKAIHLPVGGESRGWETHSLKTLIKMIGRGEEHAKTERLLIAYLGIKAPRYIWSELDTYTVGVIPGSSESTMYTLLKTLKSGNDLIPLFTPQTTLSQIDGLRGVYEEYKDTLNNNELTEVVKNNLPDGFYQYRVRAFSYQSLRRLFKQRVNHRLSWWNEFLEELRPKLEHQGLAEKWDRKK